MLEISWVLPELLRTTQFSRALYELVRRPAYRQPERETVSAHDFRALLRSREDLMAIWILIVSPYSPDLTLCASAGEGGLAALARCTTLDALQAGKVHYKLACESGVAGDYLHDPLCGLQAVLDADWTAEGFCAASRGVGGRAREGVG
ncbi:hypothetical protein FB451DRAFT_1453388 [Mycena latifolia]|nr:hypothetical protein FB451DRAFT_1453388 [Mycena latifolia]